MTSFSNVNINTIGYSHNCIRRTLRVSRRSLAVPDTVNIPPSQSASYIETNLLHLVRMEKQKQKKKHLRGHNRYQSDSKHPQKFS